MFYMRAEMPMDFDGLTQKSIFLLLKQKTPSWMKPKGRRKKEKELNQKNIVLEQNMTGTEYLWRTKI